MSQEKHPTILYIGGVRIKCQSFTFPEEFYKNKETSSDKQAIVNVKNSSTNVVRLKKYKKHDRIASVKQEFEILKKFNYTHVANMPGSLKEVLYYSRFYNMRILDSRLDKFVADSIYSGTKK